MDGNQAGQTAAENAALAQSPDPNVKVSALMKRDARREATMAGVVIQMTNAQATARAAVAANAARKSPPAKFEHKEKDPDIRQWIPLVEDYLNQTAGADYLSYASSYLAGKPRVYFMGQLDAFRAANAGADPATPRQFFRDTMIRGYGLRDPIQSYWDTWNKLSQGSGSVDAYNIGFEQALVNLGDQLTVAGLSTTLEGLKLKAGAKRVLLIVDYLQLLPIPPHSRGPRYFRRLSLP